MSDPGTAGVEGTEEPLVLVERDAPIALVRLNRPAQLNAISNGLIVALANALADIAAEPAIRCVIITGGEKAFSAGADIAEFAAATAGDEALTGRAAAWDRIRRCPVPLIAAVDGYALGGGCELVLTCDIAIATPSAAFGLPETTIGLIPGAGGTQRAIRILGKPLALEMILAGRRLTAEEALQHGLVARVVERDALLAEARRIAGEIAKRSPVAIRLAREAVAAAFETSLEDGLAREREGFAAAISSEDAKEGFAAFLEKRPPHFRGR